MAAATATAAAATAAAAEPTKVRMVLDGSHGEGGGQLVRNAVSYAAILRKPLEIRRIRANRQPKPGLRAQHVTGIQLAYKLCGGNVQGAVPESTTMEYTPNNDDDSDDDLTWEETVVGDTETAGSICLLLQTSLPCALLGRSHMEQTRLILKGGTNATMAPQYDYWEQVFLPTLQKQWKLDSDSIVPTCKARGYYPKGGGEVQVKIKSVSTTPLPPIQLTERGDITKVHIRSFVAGRLPVHMAHGMAKVAKRTLSATLGSATPIEVNALKEPNAVGSGSGILIVATTSTGCLLAGSALGHTKKQSSQVATEAAKELLSTLSDGGCVDEWLQDQLILYMALSEGTSEILTGSLTLHTQTAIWVAEQICGAKFEVTKVPDTPSPPSSSTTTSTASIYGKHGRVPGKHLIRCQGIGFTTAEEGEDEDDHGGQG